MSVAITSSDKHSPGCHATISSYPQETPVDSHLLLTPVVPAKIWEQTWKAVVLLQFSYLSSSHFQLEVKWLHEPEVLRLPILIGLL